MTLWTDAELQAHIPGRAVSHERKEHIVQQVLSLWEANNRLRLGQLLFQAFRFNHLTMDNVANIEDERLLGLLKEYWENKKDKNVV